MEAGLDVGWAAGHSHHGLRVEVPVVHLQVKLGKIQMSIPSQKLNDNLLLVPLSWEGDQPLTPITRLLLVTHVLYDLGG